MSAVESGRRCGECPVFKPGDSEANQGNCGAVLGLRLGKRAETQLCDDDYRGQTSDQLVADVEVFKSLSDMGNITTAFVRELRSRYKRPPADIITP